MIEGSRNVFVVGQVVKDKYFDWSCGPNCN